MDNVPPPEPPDESVEVGLAGAVSEPVPETATSVEVGLAIPVSEFESVPVADISVPVGLAEASALVRVLVSGKPDVTVDAGEADVSTPVEFADPNVSVGEPLPVSKPEPEISVETGKALPPVRKRYKYGTTSVDKITRQRYR